MPQTVPSQLQVRKIVLGANPAANAEASDAVPAGKWWEVLSYSIVNVQAGAGSSHVSLMLDDGSATGIMFQGYGATAAQGVSTTQRWTWSQGIPDLMIAGTTPNIFATAPLPSFIIPSGGRVRTVTVGLSANTDFAAPAITVVEYG